MTHRYITAATSFFMVSVLAMPFFVHGHAGGQSFERAVDPYVIDIGYNVTDIVAGGSVLFEFELLEDEETVNFEDVWVRITRGERTIFATGIHNAEFGGARLTYTFPEQGSYELHVRYQRGAEGIAEAVFAIDVLPNSNVGGLQNSAAVFLGGVGGLQSGTALLLGGVVGLLAGVFIAQLMRRKRMS